MSDENERSVASAGSVAGEAVRIAKCLLTNIGLDRLDEDDMVASVARWEVEQAAAELLRLNDEIARLKLTDAEQEALAEITDDPDYYGLTRTHAKVLRGLLKRLG